jgi:hypothetical protein
MRNPSQAHLMLQGEALHIVPLRKATAEQRARSGRGMPCSYEQSLVTYEP